MSRPSESETPLVEFDETALWTAAQWCKIARRYHTEWREAATAFSLAQTEIKGHMRVEDDLQAELRLAASTLTAFSRKLAEAQVRIAELEKERDAAYDKSWTNVQRADRAEKDAARYRWLRVNSTQPAEGWSTHSNPESLDAAIDAALKSRV